MGEILLGVFAGVLIIAGAAAVSASLIGMSMIAYRHFTETRESTGGVDPGSPE